MPLHSSLYSRIFSRQALTLSLTWSLFMISLFAWSAWQKKEHTLRLAEGQAQSFFNEIVYIRAWNTLHGGVYTFVTESCCPNPYLKGPDTQIQTRDGRLLTKINPAFMTRQISTIAAQRGKIQFRIAGLSPLRPGNLADPWEAEAIKAFQSGKVSQRFEMVSTNETPVFRYIAPLMAESRCLTCHLDKTLHKGSILGGISVSFAAAPLLQTLTDAVSTIHLVFTLIWLAGLGGIMTAISIIQKKQAEVEQANQAKALFMANMCHDMRTPLVGIQGVADRLLARHLSPDNQRLTGLISSSAGSLLEIVNDITDFSRLDQASLQLHPTPFNLNEMLDNALHIFRFASEQKEIAFKVLVEKNVPENVVGDEFRLRQILANLVGNAVKFTDTGEIHITLSAGPDTAPLPARFSLTIQVEDTGPGIPPGQEEAIFASFYQGDSSLAKKHVGSGLGLAICRTLATMMGGTIAAANRKEGGARFTCSVTLGVQDRTQMKGTTQDRKRESQTRPHATKKISRAILVAEDNPLNQIYLREILEEAGHRTTLAETGTQVLETLQSGAFDLIFMDVQMPEMDGLETTRRIRAWTGPGFSPRIPIIGLTALTHEQERTACRTAGMDRCLTKPVSETKLLETIATVCPEPAEPIPPASPERTDALPLLDAARALERLGGRTALYLRMTATFLNTAPDTMLGLEKQCSDGNTSEVLRLAHSLKNSAGSLGLMALEHLARDMEETARHNDLPACAEHCAELAICFENTVTLLKRRTAP